MEEILEMTKEEMEQFVDSEVEKAISKLPTLNPEKRYPIILEKVRDFLQDNKESVAKFRKQSTASEPNSLTLENWAEYASPAYKPEIYHGKRDDIVKWKINEIIQLDFLYCLGVRTELGYRNLFYLYFDIVIDIFEHEGAEKMVRDLLHKLLAERIDKLIKD